MFPKKQVGIIQVDNCLSNAPYQILFWKLVELVKPFKPRYLEKKSEEANPHDKVLKEIIIPKATDPYLSKNQNLIWEENSINKLPNTYLNYNKMYDLFICEYILH